MRLLRWIDQQQIGLTQDLDEDKRPPYAILSHTWAADNSHEVTFAEVETEEGQKKAGYEKIRFCAEQARKDGIEHFWVDTCCINKTNLVELSEAITSMYRWYQEAVKCYVYLADVSCPQQDHKCDSYALWGPQFQTSKWFTRGWTLQELLAPKTVDFYSCEGAWLNNKTTLAHQIHQITGIPVDALHNSSMTQFSMSERMRWAERRRTKKPEDRAYSLFGIFDVPIPVMYGEGEKNAFRRLQRAIQEEAGTTTQPTNVHWMVPRTANPLFTGRQELLQELEGTVRDTVYCPWERDQCRMVIWGMGGQGKSEVCLQLARRLRPMFWAVLWIDVSTRDIAERSFLEAAQRLSLPAHNWEDALYGIANLPHSWLLILDNADYPDTDYREYFPDSRHGVIVMTSRNQECEQYSTDQSVALGGLDTLEARDLLLKAAQIPLKDHSRYNEDAQRVAAMLQSHPLALVQAGAYVARGHCRLADYPRIYKRQRQRLLTFRPAQAQSRYRDVYATFEVSAEMLRAMDTPAGQDALELLPLFAVGGPSHFPLSLFEAGWRGGQRVSPDVDDTTEAEEVELLTPWHVARLPAICDAASEMWDAYRLVEAVNLLKAFSLVSTDTQAASMSVSFHALVHAWARDRQSLHEQQQTWLQMGCLAALAVAHGNLTSEQIRQVQPHIEALVGWSLDSVVSHGPPTLVARILVRCGRYLLEQRADAQLYTLLQALFTSLGLDRLQVEQAWIGLYDLAGLASHYHGRMQEAVTLLEQVVAIRIQISTEDRLSQLYSQHELARAYQANGQVREAVALLEEVVEIKKQTLAAEHPSRLASQHELAGAYQANGQVREAVALLEEVVEIKKQTLAAEHPDRLTSQHALAGAYKANGQVREAVTLLEEVVEIQKQTLAAEHPDRLASQHELAGAYKANGQVREAVALLEEVVEIEKQTLAAEHPDRLASQHALAGAYKANGQVREAVALLEEVVEIKKQTLAAEHPDRLASQHALAGAYEANGQVRKAVALLEEVVEIQKQTLAVEHPDRLASQHELARAYQANGQVRKAVALLEEVVEIQKQTLAAEHPSRLASQHALAGAYKANGQVRKAVALLEEVVEIQKQTLAVEHPDRLASQHELARAYQANGQVRKAVALLEEVVEIQKQTLAAEHPSRLASQHELAGAYQANGQVREAVALLEEVVEIRKQTLAVEHPSRLASQHALARAYRANGQVREAVALLEEVVETQKQTLAADHPSRLQSQNNLATYLWDTRDREAALSLMTYVVNTRQQVLDAHHPDRQMSEEWLAFWKEEMADLELS